VNHVQFVYAMMKKKPDNSADLADSANVAVLDYLLAHHTVIDPTLGVYEMILRSVKDDIRQMEPNFSTLPTPLQVLFQNVGMPAEQAKLAKPRMQTMMNIVKAMYDKGIPIVAGTGHGLPWVQCSSRIGIIC